MIEIFKNIIYFICNILLLIVISPMYIFWARPQTIYIYNLYTTILTEYLK